MIDTLNGTHSDMDRVRLVRLCARLSGSAADAEDLAQETLVEAWRQRHKLRDPADAGGRDRWLAAIARNVCLRHARRRARAVPHVVYTDGIRAALAVEETVADDFDLGDQLERHELVRAIDAALATLPPPTRAVLVARYVEGLPQAEIAARLGVGEGAVEARLQRGKRALRPLLARVASEGGLGPASRAGEEHAVEWQETRLWCPLCGMRRMHGRFDVAGGDFALRCPGCGDATGVYTRYDSPGLFDGVRGYKPAFNRVMHWANAFYGPALAQGAASCPDCARPMALHLSLPAEWPAHLRAARGLHARCGRRRFAPSMRLSNLALYHPQAWRFWRAHPRLRLLPERAVEAAGQPALVMPFESVRGTATLDVIAARDTYEILGVRATPGA